VADRLPMALAALTALLIVALVRLSVILARQRRQIERLIEDAAVLDAEVQALRARSAESGRDPVV
jgi:hypothetical protein